MHTKETRIRQTAITLNNIEDKESDNQTITNSFSGNEIEEMDLD